MTIASDPLAPLLAGGSPVVIDGGLATQLEAQGADLSDALWSARLLADDPGAIEAAHLAFFRAGARLAITASYQATFEGFARRGLSAADTEALLSRSVALADGARRARLAEAPAAAPLLVAASVGPYGAFLADGSEYRGRYGLSVAQLRAFHARRLAVLASAGPDLIAAETIPELEEAVAIAGLVADAGVPAWVSFSCADGRHLRSGAPIEEAVAAVASAPGVVAVGVNCTAPEHVEELVSRIRAASALPIVVYPNSGEGWDAAARRWTPGAAGSRVDPEAAARWRAAGADLVGGCCRVTPDQVALLASAAG